MQSKLTTRNCILLWFLACILLAGAHSWLKQLPSRGETYVASTTGSFGARQDRSGSIDPARALSYWTSEPRGGPGSVSIGPFPAPDRLRFAVHGRPGAGNNSVYLELELTKGRIPLPATSAGGEWETIEYDLPIGWRGRLITLNAAAGPGGGISVSQPFGRGTGSTRQYGLMETLAAWIANGLLYGAVFITLARFLARRELVAPCWVPLAACGALALVGYAAFWAYFASPALGRLFSAGVFLATLLVNVLRDGQFDRRDAEWLRNCGAAAAIGLLYVGIFHLHPAGRDFYDLASNRFIVGLPGDNRLPFDFADFLYHGQRPRELGAGWLSSDRPPLQEGWLLIGWPVTGALGFSDQAASATAALWLQLSWVFALYGLLRSMGMAQARAILCVLAASLSGFFLLHSLYTWPKLSAGAFACGTFGMWILGGCASRLRGRILGALFGGLACLSHGGAAFALIPLAAWAAWRCLRGEWAQWMLAALAFAITVAPWMAYQRYYAPPGNRLLKMHLAGQFEVDNRSAWQAISDAYRALSPRQVLDRDTASLGFQFGGDWLGADDGSAGSAEGRRTDEFLHTFRALAWWNLAAAVFLLSLLGAAVRGRLPAVPGSQRALGAWIVASMVVWCMLMFTRTEIAQGPFAEMMALFALLAVWAEAAGRWWLAVIALLQAGTLATTWMPGNSLIGGPVSPAALGLVAVAVAAAAAWAVGLRRQGSDG